MPAHIGRREFLSGLAAAAWPSAARAQQAMPAVGLLFSNSIDDIYYAKRFMPEFRRGLAETGFVEGQNVRFEVRGAEGRYDRLPALVADLIRRQVAVIVAAGAVNAALAAKDATRTIPILFAVGSDPIKMGLVASLNRPGGNITGVTSVTTELLAKRLELLREIIPRATAIGLLVNPSNPNTEPSIKELQALAQAGGWRLQVGAAGTESELDTAIASFRQMNAGGFLWATDEFLSGHSERIAALAAQHGIPGIAQRRDFVDAGGLISYGAAGDRNRPVGVYAGRILKGERPGDLPVQQPTRFETVLNLKTAKALKLDVPTDTLLRADEVIE